MIETREQSKATSFVQKKKKIEEKGLLSP